LAIAFASSSSYNTALSLATFNFHTVSRILRFVTGPEFIRCNGIPKQYAVTGNGAVETVAYPGILFGEGVQQIQLRTGDRENGDLGAVAPYSGVLEAAVIWYKKFHFI